MYIHSGTFLLEEKCIFFVTQLLIQQGAIFDLLQLQSIRMAGVEFSLLS